MTTAHGDRYADFVASRPAAAEGAAIARLLAAARATGARVHIVHLSAADALPMIAAARADGVAVTVETCPHYLSLTAEEVPDGDTRFKCCPPVRDAGNRDALWQGLADGTIDMVVSDHSPCTPELKRGDFGQAWGGIASLQLALPVVWTEARRRGHGLADVARWMAERPAALAGLAGKGRIAPGQRRRPDDLRARRDVHRRGAAAPPPDHPLRRPRADRRRARHLAARGTDRAARAGRLLERNR